MNGTLDGRLFSWITSVFSGAMPSITSRSAVGAFRPGGSTAFMVRAVFGPGSFITGRHSIMTVWWGACCRLHTRRSRGIPLICPCWRNWSGFFRIIRSMGRWLSTIRRPCIAAGSTRNAGPAAAGDRNASLARAGGVESGLLGFQGGLQGRECSPSSKMGVVGMEIVKLV